ncbi:MAG TPA: Maf family protein [Gammaproteobacteria bacterium]|nr:Maf family protein [Gammaproteobacteria bacterium]
MTKDFVYLASASPRRSDLLRQIGVRFEVRPVAIAEEREPGESPATYVTRLAVAKASAVWEQLEDPDTAPVLAADTAVVLDDRVLGKPASPAAAAQMLEQLSGRSHNVLTAVAVRHRQRSQTLLSSSEVRFRATTQPERWAYCQTGEPLDKAGGYGIQGFAAVFVEHLSGSYSAVMGLPLFETAVLLRSFGVPLWLDGGSAG